MGYLGSRHPVEMGERRAFRKAAGDFLVNFGLFAAKGITGQTVTGSSFDAANAAPARAAFGLVRAHQCLRVMDSAAVAEHCFGHCNPSANGSGSSCHHHMPLLQGYDSYFCLSCRASWDRRFFVTLLKQSFPKLGVPFP